MLRHSLCLLLLVVGCGPLVPATQPPQLAHTPGAFVVVDAETFDAGVFRVAYPQGWRIVKSSTATAPMTVVFASSRTAQDADDMPLQIWLSTAPLNLPLKNPNDLKRRAEVTLHSGQVVYAAGVAPADGPVPELEAAFQLVMRTVR